VSEIVVHHLENSRSLRLLWLLEELGLEYELREYKRNPKTIRAPAELRELHPLGKAPVVVVDGKVLAESGAIMESLLDRFDEAGELRPLEGDARDAFHYWMHYAEGSLMPVFLVRLILENIKKAKLPFFVKPIAKGIVSKVDAAYTNPELERHIPFIEAHLAGHAYFAGDAFTAADIQMFYNVDVLALRDGLSSQPKMAAWLQKVKARPAYQAAEKRGGANEIPVRKD
jgi:glutathione S-transferase